MFKYIWNVSTITFFSNEKHYDCFVLATEHGELVSATSNQSMTANIVA